MHERKMLLRLASIVEAQRVSEQVAQSALAEAARFREAREAAERRACDEVGDLLDAWTSRLCTRFDPRLLAGAQAAVEVSETRRQKAAHEAAAARSQAEARAQALHLARARVQVTAKSMRRLRRRLAKQREDQIAATLADRTTLDWSTR